MGKYLAFFVNLIVSGHLYLFLHVAAKSSAAKVVGMEMI